MQQPPKQKDKLYVIRKYIKAPNARMAIAREKLHPVHEAFLHEKWEEKGLSEAMGFIVKE